MITGDADSGFTVTNTYNPGTTSFTVTKLWDDEEDQDGRRPNGSGEDAKGLVEIQLLADGVAEGDPVALTAAAGWTYTWTGLKTAKGGKEIVYTVREAAVEGYTSKVGKVSGSTVEGYAVTVTNSHVPGTVEVAFAKVWDDNHNQDGNRPKEVTIRLLADGTEIDTKTVDAVSQTGTDPDRWEGSFTNLPKNKNGKEIVYTIREAQVPGYTVSYQDLKDGTRQVTNT